MPTEQAQLQRLRQAIAGGNADAARANFDQLAQRHAPAVLAVCRRIVRDPQVAEELAQEAWLTAAERIATFEGRSGFGTWVCGIAKMHCLNARRKRTELLSDDGVLDATDPLEGEALKSMSRKERIQLVQNAAASVLDDLEQEAVFLRYVEQLPRDEIARILGLDNKSGARALLQRCTRKLKPELRRRIALMGRGTSFVRTTW